MSCCLAWGPAPARAGPSSALPGVSRVWSRLRASSAGLCALCAAQDGARVGNMAEADTSLAETRRLCPWQLPQPPGQESASGKSVTKKFLEMVLPLPYVCPQLPVSLGVGLTWRPCTRPG